MVADTDDRKLPRITLDEIIEFMEHPAAEKLLLVSMEGCAPCQILSADLLSLLLDKQLGDLHVREVKFSKGPEFEEDAAEAMEVRHFPTLFFFKDGASIGRIRGLMPKTAPDGPTSLLNWPRLQAINGVCIVRALG